ncbi:two-component regulator propeller domain-containing protein [Bacteroidota bacterium]
MRNQRNAFFLLLFLCLLSLSTVAQRYNLPVYGIEQGLIGAQINDIDQDSLGYLWLATEKGVSRFDGKKAKNYSQKNGLGTTSCTSILCDSKNQVWIGHLSDGLSLLSNDSIIRFTEVDGFINNQVNDVFEAADGKIWVGTFGGICIYDGQQWSTLTKENGLVSNNVKTIGQDSKGNIWLGTFGSGLNIISGTKIRSIHQGSGLINNYVTSIFKKTSGEMLIGTLGGFSVFHNNSFKAFTSEDGLLNNQINAIAQKGDAIWLGSYSGIDRIDNNTITGLTEENGLPSNEMLSIFCDREDNIWVGSKLGLVKIRNLAFGHFTSTEDLDLYPTDLYKDSKGTLWVANEVGGVLKYNGYAFEPAFKDPDINDHQISSICEDGEGNLWFGTSDFGGLFQWTGERLFIYSDEFGLANNNITCLETDADGNLMIGTPSGLSRFDGFDFSLIYISDDLKTNHITAITKDNEGSVIIGSLNGSLFSVDGRSVNQILKNQNISTPITDLQYQNENLLIATNGQGFFIHNDGNGETRQFSEQQGITDPAIMSVGVVNQDVFLGSKTGLFRLSLDNKEPIISSFSHAQGFIAKQCKPGALLVDKETLWVGTTSGITSVAVNELSQTTKAPFTFIYDLQLFYKKVNWDQKGFETDENGLPKNLNLSYNDNYLRFFFNGIHHTNPEGVQYKWKLEGFEKDWNPSSSQEQANYPNLPAGKYTFKLIACNEQGECIQQPITFSFTISPPFWQTLWFYALVFSALALSVYGFFKRRERVLLEEKQVLEATVTERTKELREQKEIVEKQNEHITEGIEYAKNIQMAILPSENELNKAFKDHFVFYRPKELVGGDFYWVYDQGDVVWAAGVDCTGHGVSGAFMSMIGSDLLNQIIIEKRVDDPATVLQEMDQGIKLAFAQSAKEFESDQGMDLSLVRICKKTKSLTFAGALRPLYLLVDGEFVNIDGDRFPISCKDAAGKAFKTTNVKLKKRTCLYLFTDGFADQFGGPKGKKFMIGRLQKLIQEHGHLSMSEQKMMIEKAFDEWKGEGFPQIDDVLLMGMEV